eukprot:m.10460 g.10460  ORF g.10460 m.10460 type:complete len:60 (-) comp6040_c0_seq1:367-546(-)
MQTASKNISQRLHFDSYVSDKLKQQPFRSPLSLSVSCCRLFFFKKATFSPSCCLCFNQT